LTEFSDHDTLPPYAILSHTWFRSAAANASDIAEPTFKDLREGVGQEKHGYKKIHFCGQQARRDGLEHFWVDTCCIDKERPNELSRAIRSMFRWYRNSARCYVYLSDVHGAEQTAVARSWDSEFYKSNWFNRGWTLQELLAPRSVEFFSSEGARLGDKTSLGQQISDITNIPVSALQGEPLSHFRREDRIEWSSNRKTSLPEDIAYSLLGIFDVDMPVCYGEGAASAIVRLEAAIERRDRCIRDIRLTDPRGDKKRIEEDKGGLLKDAYSWILQNPEFQQWRSVKQSSTLWVKGDPGKGKTMLMCGIINELQKSSATTAIVPYFFCQATDRRTNTATAVLRGLIYMLVCQQPSLISYVQRDYDTAGKSLFDDVNARVTLIGILGSMLSDSLLDGAYVVVDALDECSVDLPQLLEFIANQSSGDLCVKWVVSSRNDPYIEKILNNATQAVKLSLELNEASVASAVTAYIDYKVDHLARKHGYERHERIAVRSNLVSNAHNTFLWVALVCQELDQYSGWEAEEMSIQFPSGLNPLYRRMLEHISKQGGPQTS